MGKGRQVWGRKAGWKWDTVVLEKAEKNEEMPEFSDGEER